MAKTQSKKTAKSLDQETVNEILTDYRLGHESRETSLLGRREVLTGKAKFGIFGDGKELPQIALAKQFKNGDFRSGYYRDQTWMMAAKLLTIEGFFAQLYAHADIAHEPASGGRQMNGHYATRSLDENGEWKNLTEQKNSSADISPTAGQMSRLVGLAQASKVYRNHPTLKDIEGFNKFSNNGNEVAFASIGDASTSEGPFWEAMNAIGVLKVPAVISVWDDGYGISVERKYQTTKGSISEALAGFQKSKEGERGYEIFKVKAWDYANLVRTYDEAVKIARDTHTPILVHVEECTQPQGHSTSGSHERYKSKERLEWEKEFDGLAQMRKWILSNKISDEQTLDAIEKESKKKVRDAKKAAWSNFLSPIQSALAEALSGIEQLASESSNSSFINKEFDALKGIAEPEKRDIATKVRKVLRITRNEKLNARTALSNWYKDFAAKQQYAYSSHLTSESSSNAFDVEKTLPIYEGNEEKDGREILRDNFDYILENRPEVLIFGEDSGKIGGVNQGLEGLQDKHGELRVSDTGIRENTILGQGIGMAMRGLRPIAEIQYLDYLLYAIQVISDDLATVQYRSAGGQKAPVIIRTRGHRLEGIWHSGSPMGMILNSVRGVHVCVPRNMTQAAGFYNTLLQGDEPGIVIESLNGYRLKEKVPTNIGEFTVPLGEVEVIQEGKDLTILTYGSMVRMVVEASKELTSLGINVEIIDAQTLLPFDLNKDTAKSLAKTNRLLIVDEDVPGGASAFLLQQVIDTQNGYYQLDSKPLTLTAKAHRPAYGSDGDYFSKPSVDDIVDAAYSIMQEANPHTFSSLD